MTRSIERTITVGFGLALLLLITVGIASYLAMTDLLKASDRRQQSYVTLSLLQEILSTLKDAETGQRGYIITADERYLEPYNGAAQKITSEIRSLRVVTREYPSYQGRIDTLESLATRKMDGMQVTVELRRTGNFQTAAEEVRTGRGRDLMDQIRRHIGAMITDENTELQSRSEATQSRALTTLAVIVIGSLMAIFIVAMANIVIQRGLGERRASAEALRQARDQLELRVQARTAELAQANRDLQAENRERIKAQEQLKSHAASLERSNRELQDFAYVASHDLQEPLRKIQAFSGRLVQKHGAALSPEGRDYLERMQNSAQRMQSMINDLLTFSRVTTKAQPFELVNLNQVVEAVLNDLEPRIEQTGGEVVVDDLPVIEADPGQMRQLFQNLIANALKFHREGEAPLVKVHGPLTNGTGVHPKNCQIMVEDNGIGFDEKYLDRIFTPFQRLHGRGEYEGTGIGLAICRKVAEHHGGSLTARSVPGQGATFIITLPAKQVERGASA